MFQRLVNYKKKHGDCLVPQRYKDDPRLGGWVREQRKSKANLYGHRRQLLEEVGFSWNARGLPDSKCSKANYPNILHHDKPLLHPQTAPGLFSSSPFCYYPSATSDSSSALNLLLQKQLLHLRVKQEQDAATNLCLLKMLQQKRLGQAAHPAIHRKIIRVPVSVASGSK